MSKSKTKPASVPKTSSAPPTAAAVSEKTPVWQYLVVALLPLAVWSQTLGFDLSYHDDDQMVKDKAHILAEGFRADNIFATDAWMMQRKIELYRPWQTLTYILDYQLGGTSPGVYHAHNLLIFTLNALLLFLLLRRIFPVGPAAFWGASLYSVNFLFAHAVAWIPARGDLYLFTFGVLCLLFFLDFVQKQSTWRLFASAGFFFLALLAKESAVMLLPILGLLAYFNRPKIQFSGGVWAGAGLMLAGLLFYLKLRKGAISAESADFSLAAVLPNSRTVFEELTKFALPLKFSVMPSFDATLTAVGLLLAAVVGWLLFKNRAALRPEIVVLGLALWILPYLPSLGYVPQFTGFAYDYLDHRAYFILVGLWILLLELADKTGFFAQKWARGAAIGVGIYFAAFGLKFVGTYRDWRVFYENATTTNPRSGLAASNMGTRLATEGKTEEALAWFEKAKKINPDDPDTRTRLADMLVKMKRYDEAIAEATAGISPKNMNQAKALAFRAVAYGSTGRPELALADFQAATKLAPDDAEHWRNAGACLKDLGRHAEAVESLNRAIELNPKFVAAYFDRGFCYGFGQKFAEAKADMDKVIALEPKNGAAWFFRGRARLSLGEREAACTDFAQAKSLNIKEAEGFWALNCGGD